MFAVQSLERFAVQSLERLPGSSRTGSEQSRPTLPKNLIARLSRAGSSLAVEVPEAPALAGTVRAVQAMGKAKRQQTEREKGEVS